jgi:[ribosomal protein S5]-alanine N-acetyltransferase
LGGPVVLLPCQGEAELSDPAVTGQFADAMASIAAEVHTPPWCGYIARRNGVPVGFGGFKGAPADDRTIEFGYLTFPQHEGTGVAKAVAAAMISTARDNGMIAVLAHTLCEENPSTGVLRANGFVRDGFGEDADEGTVWRWRLNL